MQLSKEDYNIFNLITQAQIGIRWIYESVNPQNNNQTFEQVVNRVSANNGNILLFNQGTALMFAYISLVLPKESLFKQLDTSNISTEQFSILENTYPCNKNKGMAMNIIRHVRNALAHGYVNIYDDKYFEFTDQNPSNSEQKFHTRIDFVSFSKFISNYYFTLKNEYFEP